MILDPMASWTGSWWLLTRMIFMVSGLLQVKEWATENAGSLHRNSIVAHVRCRISVNAALENLIQIVLWLAFSVRKAQRSGVLSGSRAGTCYRVDPFTTGDLGAWVDPVFPD